MAVILVIIAEISLLFSLLVHPSSTRELRKKGGMGKKFLSFSKDPHKEFAKFESKDYVQAKFFLFVLPSSVFILRTQRSMDSKELLLLPVFLIFEFKSIFYEKMSNCQRTILN